MAAPGPGPAAARDGNLAGISASNPDAGGGGEADAGTGVVRQWMSELASGTRPVAHGGGTVRAPGEAEVGLLTGMFPDIEREVVLGVLQRR